jgi:hypothetical protein
MAPEDALAVLTDEGTFAEAAARAKNLAGDPLQQCQRMQRTIDHQIARARAAASRSVPGRETAPIRLR